MHLMQSNQLVLYVLRCAPFHIVAKNFRFKNPKSQCKTHYLEFFVHFDALRRSIQSSFGQISAKQQNCCSNGLQCDRVCRPQYISVHICPVPCTIFWRGFAKQFCPATLQCGRICRREYILLGISVLFTADTCNMLQHQLQIETQT